MTKYQIFPLTISQKLVLFELLVPKTYQNPNFTTLFSTPKMYFEPFFAFSMFQKCQKPKSPYFAKKSPKSPPLVTLAVLLRRVVGSARPQIAAGRPQTGRLGRTARACLNTPDSAAAGRFHIRQSK